MKYWNELLGWKNNKKWIPPAILKNLSPKSARFNPKSTDPMLFFPINVQSDLGFFMPVNSDIAFR